MTSFLTPSVCVCVGYVYVCMRSLCFIISSHIYWKFYNIIYTQTRTRDTYINTQLCIPIFKYSVQLQLCVQPPHRCCVHSARGERFDSIFAYSCLPTIYHTKNHSTHISLSPALPQKKTTKKPVHPPSASHRNSLADVVNSSQSLLINSVYGQINIQLTNPPLPPQNTTTPQKIYNSVPVHLFSRFARVQHRMSTMSLSLYINIFYYCILIVRFTSFYSNLFRRSPPD